MIEYPYLSVLYDVKILIFYNFFLSPSPPAGGKVGMGLL